MATLTVPADRKEMEKILQRARKGDESVLPAVREMEARLAAMEKALEDVTARSNHLECRLAGDLTALKQSAVQQTAAINDTRRTMAQTDEMVRRVVEALESLQTVVLDAVESGNKPVIPVN